MRSIRTLLLALSLFTFLPAASFAVDPAGASKDTPRQTAEEKCAHGVKKAICTRCNPKLEGVFKSKNDWCPEHGRPETQCSLCHPDLAAQGVK